MSENSRKSGSPTQGDRVDAHRPTMEGPPLPSSPRVSASGDGADGPSSGTFATWIGRTIDDRYRIDALLGEGGMGAVLLAEHLKLGKKVALKVVLPQFAGVGEVAERFAREAMASGQLDHPHIASALDYGTLPEGGAYLVMQYVRGQSLRGVMTKHVGDWAFACEVGAQIADALSAAHAARIVHRDLKPENVMLESREGGSESLHVRVLDFGVARVVGDETTESAGARKLTRVGTILGTPGYMAPEQALGESVDERADLYALGVLLWECVVGHELFEGADVPSIVTAQLTQPIEPLGALVPSVPPELDALVYRLLSPRRDDRPGKASEVRDTLRRFALTRQLERVSLAGTESGSHPIDPSRPFNLHTTDPGHAAPSGQAHAQGSQGFPQGSQGFPQASQGFPQASQGYPQASQGYPQSNSHGHAAAPKRLPLQSLLPPGLREGRRGYLAIAGGLGLLLVIAGVGIGVMLSGDDAPAVVHVPIPVPVAGTNRPPTTPVPTPPPRVEIGSVTPPAGQDVPVTPVAAPFPPQLAGDVAILLESDARETRQTAAEALLARPAGSLPPVVQLLAELETGEGCTAKRNALRALRELRDTRALPAVERIDRIPRRGCGMFGMGDCWGCLRGETRRTLRSLRGEAAATGGAEEPTEE